MLEKRKQAIRNAKARAKAESRYLGGRKPFGYDIENGILKPDEDDQYVIAKIKVLAASGEKVGLRTIAKFLEDHNLASVSHMTIKRILDRN